MYLKVKQRVFIFGFGGGRSPTPLALQLIEESSMTMFTHGGAKFLAKIERKSSFISVTVGARVHCSGRCEGRVESRHLS